MQQKELTLLIQDCKKQKHKAQVAVYNLFFKAMYNTAFRIVQDQHLAEDIMQEAFIAAFSKLDTLKEEVTFPKWLKQIVVRKSFTHIKKIKKFSSLDVERLEIETDEIAIEVDIEDFGVQRIISSINSLKDNYRVLLTLHYIEGYDYEELVEITGFTYINCRTIISRAKESLRKKLAL